MRKYLDLTSWFLLFFFAPFTVLVLLSQNTIPGDLFYPVKRGLENIILVAASVSPSSKVAYRTDLTQRRFTEAQQLLVLKADTTAYNEFIDQVASAQQDLSSLSNSQDKIQSSEKLIAKIEEYKTQLAQVQNQVQVAQALPQNQFQTSSGQIQNQATPNPFFQPTSSPVALQTGQTSQPVSSPAPNQPNQTIQQVQTPAPNQPGPIAQPAQNTTQQPSQNQPVVTPVPANVPTPQPLAPAVTNQIANNPQKAEKVKETIKNTLENLDKAEKELKKGNEDAKVEEKVKDDQQKLQEQLKKRQENGGNH